MIYSVNDAYLLGALVLRCWKMGVVMWNISPKKTGASANKYGLCEE